MGADGSSRTFFKCFSNSFLYIIQTFNEYFVLPDCCFTAFDVYDKQIYITHAVGKVSGKAAA